ncbi:hypothetical protein ACFC08_35215 [Streptomyces sp. NPDC056112]|uniref:hypothetical protein n=1 Tax=Streptomyces sp. NPDC056112 TaxID=3345715 RepID=UPI0035D9CC77
MTYEQMAYVVNGAPSKATFERAASGASVPSWETIYTFLVVTQIREEIFTGRLDVAIDRAMDLWLDARRATRAPYYLHKRPDPDLVGSVADLSRALRDLHVWVGYPSPGEMEGMCGPGELPRSTTRRIIQGRTLPASPEQAIAFLKACYVHPLGIERWLAAAVRAFERDRPHDLETYSWVKAHAKMRKENQEHSDDQLIERVA